MKQAIVLEFESAARARQWYDSEEYRAPRALRMKAGRTDMVMVDGVA